MRRVLALLALAGAAAVPFTASAVPPLVLPAVLGVAALPGMAAASVPAGVTTSLSAIGVDGSTVATTILLAVVAIFAIKFLRRGL